jgi:hypothetical protein
MKRNVQKEREDFMFAETLSELPLVPRTTEQITHELFKGSDPEKVIDAYEQQMGIKSNGPVRLNTRYRNIMLSPGVDEDEAKLLNDLYNDTELYQIVNRTAYWTPRGEIKLFMEYMENMDVKAEREKSKKIEEIKKETTNE